MPKDWQQAYSRSEDFNPVNQQIASAYDDIIGLVSQAQNCRGSNERLKFLDAALKVVGILQQDLNKDLPKDLYSSMNQFYWLLIRQINQAKLSDQEDHYRSTIKGLEKVRDTWQGLS